MIEGGASVIRSLLSSKDVVDKLIVTVSPTLIGSDGVSIITVSRSMLSSPHSRFIPRMATDRYSDIVLVRNLEQIPSSSAMSENCKLLINFVEEYAIPLSSLLTIICISNQ